MNASHATNATVPGAAFLHPDCGFIHHPADRPISVRRLPFWHRWRRSRAARHGPGIVFGHTSYLRPGSVVEVTIPLRDAMQRFRGYVVLVRQTTSGYEIGLRVLDPDQGARIRIVEQICHIESYIRSQMAAGQALTPNHAAREWIDRNAATFPSS